MEIALQNGLPDQDDAKMTSGLPDQSHRCMGERCIPAKALDCSVACGGCLRSAAT